MTQETSNFITRHITSLREVAGPLKAASPGLAELLDKSARIIEQLVDGQAKLRAEHERERNELGAQLHNLAAQMQAKLKLAEGFMVEAMRLPAPPEGMQTWQNLPCSPTDLNALIKLMPGGWAEVEWSAEHHTFVVMNSWGVTPAGLEDYDWQDLHPDPGPGMRATEDEHFEAWPEGRRCFAEYLDDSEEQDAGFTLLAINDVLVYADPVGAPEPATYFMCKACDANLGAADPEPHDHCPICHKDGTLLLMREDGVRVP